jgi:hypothetical protein
MRVLWIALASLSSGAPVATRGRFMAAGLRELGTRVRMLVAEGNGEDTMGTIIVPRRHIATKPKPSNHEQPGGWRKGVRRQLYRMIQPDPGIFWLPAAARQVAEVAREWRPHIIYTSGPPHSVHLLSVICGIRWPTMWVAELRDPWVGTQYQKDGPVRAMLERQALQHAAALVGVAPKHCLRLKKRYPYHRVWEVPNGFQQPHGFERSKRDIGPRLLVHAGSLYGGRRDPTMLIEGIRMARERGSPWIGIFAGPDSGVAKQVAEARGVGEWVRSVGILSREDTEALVGRADALGIIVASHDQESVPSKFYQYLPYGIPLLLTGADDAASVSALHQAAGRGPVLSDASDVCEALAVIASGRAKHWEQGNQSTWQKWSWRERASDLHDNLRLLLREKGLKGK